MKNKVISFLILFTMILGFTKVPSFSKDITKDYTDEAGLLKALDIISPEYVLKDEEITRGEFTKYLVYTFGFKNNIGETNIESVFKDVTKDSKYAKEIGIAYNMGLVNGYNDNTYRPDEKMAFNDAVTIILSGLGYGYKANAMGGYPTGYLMVGKNTGLLKGVSAHKNITYNDTVKLLANALEVNLMTSDVLSSDKDKISIKESDRTLLYDVFHIKTYEGIVNANDLTWLKRGMDVDPYRIVIDNTTLCVGKTNADELLGYNVKAYATKGEKTNEDTIIYIVKNKEKNKEILIDIDDITNISPSGIRYTDDKDNEEIIKIDPLASVIYNKVATATPLDNNIIPKGNHGFIRVLANNNDKNNVIFIDTYKDYFVTYVNKKDFIIKSNNEEIKLDPKDEDNYVDLCNSDGSRGGFSKIKKYSVLSVYESKKDNKQPYTRVYISNNQITGKVTEYSKENNKINLTVEGETYKYLGKDIDDKINTLKANRTYTLSFNYLGMVAGIKETAKEGQNWGYIVDGKIIKDPVSKTLKIKIFHENEAFNTYNVNPKVTVDGKFYKDKLDEVYNILDETSDKTYSDIPNCISQLIKFEIDDNENIINIDTICDYNKNLTNIDTIDTDNKVFTEDKGKGRFQESTMVMLEKFILDPNIKIFAVPFPKAGKEDYKDESKYGVFDITILMHASDYSFKAYFDNDDFLATNIAVTDFDELMTIDKADYSLPYAMFDKLTLAVDSEGNECLNIYYYRKGTYYNNLCDADVKFKDVKGNEKPLRTWDSLNNKWDYNLKKGDIINFFLSKTNKKITSVEVGYSASENTISDNVEKGFTQSNRLVTGYILEKYEDGMLFLKGNSRDILPTASRNSAELVKKPNCSIICYDKTLNKITSASYGDLEAYKDTKDKNKCSYIVYNSKDGTAKSVFIIKE